MSLLSPLLYRVKQTHTTDNSILPEWQGFHRPNSLVYSTSDTFSHEYNRPKTRYMFVIIIIFQHCLGKTLSQFELCGVCLFLSPSLPLSLPTPNLKQLKLNWDVSPNFVDDKHERSSGHIVSIVNPNFGWRYMMWHLELLRIKHTLDIWPCHSLKFDNHFNRFMYFIPFLSSIRIRCLLSMISSFFFLRNPFHFLESVVLLLCFCELEILH